MIKAVYIVLICTTFELYSIQEELVKEAFHQLDKPQQKLVCQGIKQQKQFTVTNDDDTIQMTKIQGDGRVRIFFKNQCNFEVLTSAFNKLCSK